MRQQEEKLRAKYGDLKPKKKLIHKVRASERAAETKEKDTQPTVARFIECCYFAANAPRVLPSPRSFTLTSRDRVLKSHAREQDVKYFDSADYSLQQVRAVCAVAGRARPRA